MSPSMDFTSLPRLARNFRKIFDTILNFSHSQSQTTQLLHPKLSGSSSGSGHSPCFSTQLHSTLVNNPSSTYSIRPSTLLTNDANLYCSRSILTRHQFSYQFTHNHSHLYRKLSTLPGAKNFISATPKYINLRCLKYTMAGIRFHRLLVHIRDVPRKISVLRVSITESLNRNIYNWRQAARKTILKLKPPSMTRIHVEEGNFGYMIITACSLYEKIVWRLSKLVGSFSWKNKLGKFAVYVTQDNVRYTLWGLTGYVVFSNCYKLVGVIADFWWGTKTPFVLVTGYTAGLLAIFASAFAFYSALFMVNVPLTYRRLLRLALSDPKIQSTLGIPVRRNGVRVYRLSSLKIFRRDAPGSPLKFAYFPSFADLIVPLEGVHGVVVVRVRVERRIGLHLFTDANWSFSGASGTYPLDLADQGIIKNLLPWSAPPQSGILRYFRS